MARGQRLSVDDMPQWASSKKKQFYLNIINVVLVLISCKYSGMSFLWTVG